MSDAAKSDRAARHVAAFNMAVRSGEWADGSGATGTMTLRWSGDLIDELTVAFS